jgi:RNA polymerase sigma-70 factor (sigma-E family)
MDGTTWVRVASGSGPSGRAEVTELFGLHYRRLVGVAVLLVDDRETAEDVVQDAFEALYRHWPRLRNPQAAVTYLTRSVVNGSRSRLRRRRTERAYVLPEAEVLPSAETSGIRDGEYLELVGAMRALPRRQREVVVLRYFLDLSEAQIADWLGVSRGSVKRHASRAMTALQERMEAWA